MWYFGLQESRYITWIWHKFYLFCLFWCHGIIFHWKKWEQACVENMTFIPPTSTSCQIIYHCLHILSFASLLASVYFRKWMDDQKSFPRLLPSFQTGDCIFTYEFFVPTLFISYIDICFENRLKTKGKYFGQFFCYANPRNPLFVLRRDFWMIWFWFHTVVPK